MTLQNSIDIQLKGTNYCEEIFKKYTHTTWQTKSMECSKLKPQQKWTNIQIIIIIIIIIIYSFIKHISVHQSKCFTFDWFKVKKINANAEKHMYIGTRIGTIGK